MSWNNVRNCIRDWTVRRVQEGHQSRERSPFERPARIDDIIPLPPDTETAQTGLALPPAAVLPVREPGEWDEEENRDPNEPRLVFVEQDTGGDSNSSVLHIQNDSPGTSINFQPFPVAGGSGSYITTTPADGDMWYGNGNLNVHTGTGRPANYTDVYIDDDHQETFTIRVNTELFNVDLQENLIEIRRRTNNESNNNGEHTESPGDSLQRSEDMLQRWDPEQNTPG